MAFAIMRAKKLASMGSVASSMQHNFRERETPNADPERTPENEHLQAQTTDEAMGKLRDLLPEKRRKDAVLVVEYVMSASPEWWKTATETQQKAFFEKSQAWLADKYGKENILVASIHKDETSPHLSAFVVPKTADGRLSAKDFIGNRDKMRKDQTTFAERVADLGLERGIEGSKATHQRINAHYNAIENASKDVPRITVDELKPKKLKGETLAEKIFGAKETDLGVAHRLTAKIKGYAEPLAKTAATASQNAQKAKEYQETAKNMRNQLNGIKEPFKGLNREQMTEVLTLATRYRLQNEREQKERAQTKTKSRDNPGQDRGR
jgi:hypothetical protein